MPKLKEIKLKIKATVGSATFEADKPNVPLAMECDAKITALTGEASLVFEDGSVGPGTIQWSWEGKERGAGSSPGTLPSPSEQMTAPITVVATVWYDRQNKKASFLVSRSCSIDKPKPGGDLDLLARVVHAEAGLLSDDEKAAVAWTVMNRLALVNRTTGKGRDYLLKAFCLSPSVWSIVTHQAIDGNGKSQMQYQSYWDGKNNKDGKHPWKALDRAGDPKSPLSCDECAKLEKSVEIAKGVFEGKRADPFRSQGGTFFMHLAPEGVAKPDHKWIRRLPRSELTHYFWTFDYAALSKLNGW